MTDPTGRDVFDDVGDFFSDNGRVIITGLANTSAQHRHRANRRARWKPRRRGKHGLGTAGRYFFAAGAFATAAGGYWASYQEFNKVGD